MTHASGKRHTQSASRPSSHALKSNAPAKWSDQIPARNSTDDVTMSSTTSWWAEEVALERVSLAHDERERLARRRAARLACSEEQERRVRQYEIARAMDMVERMEERETATRMEECERRRRMKEVEEDERAALLEQHAQRSSALHSIVQERDRILNSNGTAGGAALRVEPTVSIAIEREMQRRAASQMFAVKEALTDDASVSSTSLLQGILAKFAEQGKEDISAKTCGEIGEGSVLPSNTASRLASAPGTVFGVQPTPRTEFSRRVKPVGLNNLSSMDLSQDLTGTSTLDSTQGSAINPLMSFGSPGKDSPLGMSTRDTPSSKTIPRMRGLVEEDSLLNNSDSSVWSGQALTAQALSVRVSALEVLHLPKNENFGKCDCYIEVRCGIAEGRTKAVRNSYTAKFSEVFTLPIAGEDDLVVILRDWDRMASSTTISSVTIPLTHVRRDGILDASIPLTKPNGSRLVGHDGQGTLLTLRLEDPQKAFNASTTKPSNTLTTFANTFALSPASSSGGEQGSAKLGHNAWSPAPHKTSASAHTHASASPQGGIASAHVSTGSANVKAATAGANQRMLDASDALTRELFQPALAASPQGMPCELPAASSHRTAPQPLTSRWTLGMSCMSAEHVPTMDVVGTCEPYLKVTVGGVERKTSKLKNARQAEWTEAFEFGVDVGVREAVVSLMDWDRLGKDELVCAH